MHYGDLASVGLETCSSTAVRLGWAHTPTPIHRIIKGKQTTPATPSRMIVRVVAGIVESVMLAIFSLDVDKSGHTVPGFANGQPVAKRITG